MLNAPTLSGFPRATRRPHFARWRILLGIGTTLAIFFLCCLPAACFAHPISITRTFVYVNRQQASAKIEVFLEDLFLFHNLEPNDADFLTAETIRRGIELHKSFVAERFVIQDVQGRTLKPNAPPTVEADIPAAGVPLAELMAHQIMFAMRYTFGSAPEFLTFRQRFTDEDAVFPSEMRLRVKQENAGVPFDKTLLPNVPYSLRFSWTNPPLTPDASEDESARWVARQQQETLGITSYSSVFSFLYIEDYEIRHEILIPLLTLQESLPIARDDDDFLDIAEQDAARPRIEAYFTSGNPIEVDGQPIEPVVQRCEFYGLDFKDFAQQADRKQVSMASARVGLILSYPLRAPPTSLKLTWDRFNKSLWAVNMVVFAYDDARRTTLSRIARGNVYRWESPGRQEEPPLVPIPAVFPPGPTVDLPIFSICLLLSTPIVLAKIKRRARGTAALWIVGGVLLVTAGLLWPRPIARIQIPLGRAPEISEQKADEIFARVHANIYGAFRFREESVIYDALAVSTAGELLRDVYLQLQRGLKMQEQGGAVARIRRIEIIHGQRQTVANRLGDARGAQSFAYRCRWNVAGTVEHWGHVHERTNQYEALFTLKPIDGAWKVTKLELLDEQRLRFETRLRKL